MNDKTENQHHVCPTRSDVCDSKRSGDFKMTNEQNNPVKSVRRKGESFHEWANRQPRYKHTCKRCAQEFTNIVERCEYCASCEINNDRERW